MITYKLDFTVTKILAVVIFISGTILSILEHSEEYFKIGTYASTFLATGKNIEQGIKNFKNERINN